MKTRWITMFALGVIGAIANPLSKQTITSDNKNQQQSESIESQTKHEESTLNNGEEQKKTETIDIPEQSASDHRKYDDKVEIIIEGSVVSPLGDAPRPVVNFPSLDDAPRPIDDVLGSLDDVPRPIDIVPSPFDDIQIPIADAPIPYDMAPQMPDGFEDDFPVNDIPFRDAPMNKIQDEIMETAAGFVPTPLVFRRKQKPRHRFATRRHFKPNLFRRKFHFFYPYYGFYRPSSLRFY